MEIITYEYTKQRREFGHHPVFGDSGVTVETVPQDDEYEKQWVTSAVTHTDLDCIPDQAMHEINTERFVQTARGTCHTDGAWPPEIKTNEFQDRQRYLRRIMNEATYQNAVCNLVKSAENCIAQNNTIDIYEEYFLGEEFENDVVSDPHYVQTAAVFRDPNKVKRQATKISWHPDGASKLAVSYANMQFQSAPQDMPMMSYIWDVNNPNQPDAKIIPSSPLCCLVYNPRSPDHLVGGSYNGLVGFWDLRKGSAPVESSVLEKSHHDPVYDLFWVQSRTGNECCSVSTDGQILWWDIRKLKAGPTDSMTLGGGSDSDMVFGGNCMEYRADAGATRYLVGSEQGVVLLCDRKAKKDAESQKSIKQMFGLNGGAHHGPIYSVQRNPFNVKYFLSVGDWSAKLWMEDLKNPLLSTRYQNSYLTNACWSPSRPGVFFTTKMDGTLDVWDLYHKQNDPAFSTKVGESPLSSIRVHQAGKMVALGSADGTVTVLQLSKGLYEMQKEEKSTLSNMFDRELKREKNLEMKYILRKRDKDASDKEKARRNSVIASPGPAPPSASAASATMDDDKAADDAMKQVEEEFFAALDPNNKKNQLQFATADGSKDSSDNKEATEATEE